MNPAETTHREESRETMLPANYSITAASIVPRADAFAKIIYGLERLTLLDTQKTAESKEGAYVELRQARITYEDIAREWSTASETQRKELALTAYYQPTDIVPILLGSGVKKQLLKLEEDLLNASGVKPEDFAEVPEAIKLDARQVTQRMDW